MRRGDVMRGIAFLTADGTLGVWFFQYEQCQRNLMFETDKDEVGLPDWIITHFASAGFVREPTGFYSSGRQWSSFDSGMMEPCVSLSFCLVRATILIRGLEHNSPQPIFKGNSCRPETEHMNWMLTVPPYLR
jgi:hypothetical protein